MKLNYSYCLRDLPKDIKKNLKNAKVFYSVNYEKYLKKQNMKVIYMFNSVYLLLIIIKKEYFFNYAEMPVELFNYNMGKNINEKEEQIFLDMCLDMLNKKFNVVYIKHTYATSLFNIYPKQSLRIPFASHIIDLEKNTEEIWLDFHSKHKNVIRRAQKNNVEIRRGHKEFLNDFYKLQRMTCIRTKRDVPSKKYYNDLLKYLKKNIEIFIAYKDNEPQGTALFLYNNSMCYYMFGASKNNPELGSMNFLHWKAIQYMKSKNVHYYSFVGCRINEDKESKYHGIQRFKERFGGDLKKCYLFKSVLQKNKYKLIKFIRTLENSSEEEEYDIIDQEIYKWKRLNQYNIKNYIN